MGILKASWSVLTNPEPATFDKYKRSSWLTAVLYVLIAALFAAIIEYIGFGKHLENRMELGLIDPSRNVAVISAFVVPIVLFLAVLLVVYVAARLTGASGTFGELAYAFSLFWAPLLLVRSIIWLPAYGDLGWLGWLAWIIVTFYALFMVYGAIQSCFALSGGQAFAVILGVGGVILTIVIMLAFLVAFGKMGAGLGSLGYLM